MAAGSTYTPLGTITVSGTTTNVVTFNSIPQTYTDLIVVSTVRSNQAVALTGFHVTTNSGQYFSATWLVADGASVTSSRYTNAYDPSAGVVPGSSATASAFATNITHIFNYANSTTYKTILSRTACDLNGSGQTSLYCSMVKTLTPVTYVNCYLDSAYMITAGSTFTLYGVTAA